jgi:hypothetical protein
LVVSRSGNNGAVVFFRIFVAKVEVFEGPVGYGFALTSGLPKFPRPTQNTNQQEKK